MGNRFDVASAFWVFCRVSTHEVPAAVLEAGWGSSESIVDAEVVAFPMGERLSKRAVVVKAATCSGVVSNLMRRPVHVQRVPCCRRSYWGMGPPLSSHYFRRFGEAIHQPAVIYSLIDSRFQLVVDIRGTAYQGLMEPLNGGPPLGFGVWSHIAPRGSGVQRWIVSARSAGRAAEVIIERAVSCIPKTTTWSISLTPLHVAWAAGCARGLIVCLPRSTAPRRLRLRQ